MGSLMAGWDSPALDLKSAILQRNRSLTKDEIDAFWRTKKETEEEHLRAVSNLSATKQVSKEQEEEEFEKKRFHKSSTLAFARIKASSDVDVDASLEQLIKKNGWWTKSNWAFLNEPPVMEAASNKYASQFHVANLGSSKSSLGDEINA